MKRDSGPSPAVRYPLDPLLDAMGCTLSQAAPLLALNGIYYRKYRDEGVTRETAELFAMKAGFHPYEIVEWDMARHDLEDFGDGKIECAAWDCNNRFDLRNRGGSRRWPQRFCSDPCRNRSKQRRLRGSEIPAATLCAARDCEAVFVANRRFCSKACQRREKQRRYRAKPEHAEAHRQAQRRYRDEVKALVARRSAARSRAVTSVNTASTPAEMSQGPVTIETAHEEAA